MAGQDIARMVNLGRSLVLAPTNRFSRPQGGDSQKRPSQLPFDSNDRDRRVVRCEIEREVIRLMRVHRVGGLFVETALQTNQLGFPPIGSRTRKPGSPKWILAMT
jgi:hypothetical protein